MRDTGLDRESAGFGVFRYRYTPTQLLTYGPYGVIGLWSIVAAYLSWANPTVGLSDTFAFISRAENLSIHTLWPWVDGFYPLGYPLTLRCLATLVEDYVLAGRILSLLSAVLGLVIIGRLGKDLFGPSVAFVALIVCAANPVFLKHATSSGTDMPAAAFLLLGLYWVYRYRTKNKLPFITAAGAAMGIAYLMRYTALPVALVCAFYLWFQRLPKDSVNSKLRRSGFFALAFLATASPQLVLSAIQEGNPFFNLQAQNVYFGLFGEGNWGLHMHAARSAKGLHEVVSQDLNLYFKHWLFNLLLVPRIHIVRYPLHLLGYCGLLFSLKQTQLRNRSTLLIVSFIAFTTTICLAFPSPRLLLFGDLILSIFAGYALLTLLPKWIHRQGKRPIPLRWPSLMAISAILLAWTLGQATIDPLPVYDRNRIEVSRTLSQHWVIESSSVLSLSFEFYLLDKPTKDRFALPWYATEFEPYRSIEDLAQRMHKAGQRFLVFDHNAPLNVRGLERIWPFDSEQLAENFELIARFSGDFKPVASFSGPVYVYRLRMPLPPTMPHD